MSPPNVKAPVAPGTSAALTSESPRRTTLTDIARAVGVSEATVSRALRDDSQIGERTRAAVRLVAAELAYVPNHAAQSLAKAATLTLGLMVPDVVDTMHGQVVTGFERVAVANGYAVLVVNGFRDRIREARGFDLFRRHQMDAVALCGTISSIEGAHRVLQGPPIVLIGPEAPEDGEIVAGSLDSVAVLQLDERQGMFELVRHLLATGRTRLSYLNGYDVRSNRIRREALVAALEHAGVEPRVRDYLAPGGRDHYGPIVGLIERERPDAVVCYDDASALYLLAALRSRGIRVPEDVAVTGFDDVPFAEIANPALTTVAQPAEELGARAATLLLGSITDGKPIRSERFPVRLVVRESTAEPIDR